MPGPLLQPQVSVGMQYRINDQEIAVDFSEGFEDMGLEDAFSGLFKTSA